MVSLFAIVLSIAMLLTGTPGGEDAQPLGKILRIENIAVEYDGETVELAPVAVMGIQTDGQKAVYDFYIDQNGERLLPMQLVADAEKALLLCDSANTTLKMTREDLKKLAGTGEPTFDSLESTSGYWASTLSTYGEVFRMMDDPEAMRAFQEEADRIYNQVVERGKGVSEKLVYQGETMESTSYEYDVTAAQFAALIEALCARNEVLDRYSRSYFDMMATMPSDSPMAGVDSWQTLYEKQNVKMHVVESLAQNGLFLRDCVLSMTLPGTEQSVNYDLNMVINGEHRETTISSEFEFADMFISIYGDSNQDGGEQQGSMTISVSRAGGSRFEGEKPDDADAPEAGEAEPGISEIIPDDQEPDIIPEGDGGSSGEELLYTTVDFSIVPRSLMNFEVNADVTGGGEYGFSIENTIEQDGSSTARVTFNRVADEHDMTVSLDAKLTDGQVDLRAAEDGAVSALEGDAFALLADLRADVAKLTEDEGVQKVTRWLQEAVPSAPAADENPSETPEDAPVEESQSAKVTYAGEDLDLASVSLTYLPQGFRVTDTIVDEENDFVSLTVSNSAGVNIYVSLSESVKAQSLSETRYFIIDPEGGTAPLAGTLVNCEDSGDYVIYNADDGLVSYSVFPDGGDIPAEEIVKLLAGIRFD